jgi:hypothetical protein
MRRRGGEQGNALLVAQMQLSAPIPVSGRDWFDRLCHGIARPLVDPAPAATAIGATIVRVITVARRAEERGRK